MQNNTSRGVLLFLTVVVICALTEAPLNQLFALGLTLCGGLGILMWLIGAKKIGGKLLLMAAGCLVGLMFWPVAVREIQGTLSALARDPRVHQAAFAVGSLVVAFAGLTFVGWAMTMFAKVQVALPKPEPVRPTLRRRAHIVDLPPAERVAPRILGPASPTPTPTPTPPTPRPLLPPPTRAPTDDDINLFDGNDNFRI